MAFVLDASVALAWHFVEEGWEAAEDIARRAVREGMIVPGHFQIEVAGGLLRAEREGRTGRAEIEAFLRHLSAMPVEIANAALGEAFDHLLPLARDQRLKLFDAAYLYLAMIRRLPLATFDGALARAARDVGVTLVEARP